MFVQVFQDLLKLMEEIPSHGKKSWDLKYVDRITFLGDVKITLDTVKKAFIKVEGVELNHEGNLANIRKKAVEEASVSKWRS